MIKITHCKFLVLFFLICTSTILKAQEFNEDINFNIPNANYIDLGDYDNDNDLDLLVAHEDSGIENLSIYKNINGTFQLSHTLLENVRVQAIWGDFNNDDKLDILASGFEWDTFENFICILNISETAVDTAFYTNDYNVSNPSLSCIDFNNDGFLDFLITGEDTDLSGEIYTRLYKNNGDNTFTNLANHGITPTGQASMDWADFNNDGYYDLLIAGFAEDFSTENVTDVLINNGNETFSKLGGDFYKVFNGTSKWIDINNDGDLDIISTGGGNDGYRMSIYLNNEGVFINSTLAADYNFPNVTENFPAGISLVDYDNDGDQDIFISGRGGGSTNPIAVTKLFQNTGSDFIEVENIGIEQQYLDFTIFADLNNDGDKDLVSLNRFTKPIIYENSRGNNIYTNNTKPLPPTNFEYERSVTSALFSWNAGSDNQSNNETLDYSLYVSDNSLSQNLISPTASINSGFRKIFKTGNTIDRSRKLELNSEGNIYWGVQSIDGAFIGSNFSTEQSFYFIKGTFPTLKVLNEPLRVEIEWIDNSNIENSYQLYKSTNSSNLELFKTLNANATFHIDSVVSPESSYNYKLTAKNDIEESVGIVNEVILLDRPIKFNYSSQDSTFSWEDKSSFEHGYVIQQSIDSSKNFISFDSIAANSTNYQIKSSLNEGLYNFRIHAFNQYGRSNLSDTLAIPFIKSPSNLQAAISFNPNSFNLSWMNNSEIAESTIVSQSSNGSDFEILDSLDSYINQYIITEGIESEKIYTFKLEALKDSSRSQEIIVEKIILNRPEGLKYEKQGDNIVFSWDDKSSFEESYTIELLKDSSNNFISLDSIGSNETTTLINNSLLTEGTYKFRLHAFSEIGRSNYSDTLIFEKINAPSNLQIEISYQPNIINLTWTNNSEIAKYTVISRSDNSEDFIIIDSVDISADQFIIEEPTLNQAPVSFRLHAITDLSRSQYIFSDGIITSNSNVNNEIIKIFPNPVQDYLHIQNNEADQELSVFVRDFSGKTLFHKIIPAGTSSKIDVKNLNPSIYILALKDHQNKWKRFKIVKK
ncbi:FG-GAP-like repeat-containing protein [Marivirga harenae]|uniref:FG-GAP-like repeat-containing protein n=1 Tax=Marivirga harenae TaxID=2010992 RepID=UPI0026E0D454|nr:FG-GAP-like repeat-containing protein [Marivirga harenae]WKV13344.1 FG-GAP-like repeat-containing protein [Marivirga harenae]|tara:strand:+ start:167309 stop:170437 length:3129 start_codon:yes stop_codon:yes gene_type:complete